MATVRKFNTEGPVVAADHYCIPPLERIDLDAVLGLIRDKKYFVLHAPRQTGKTSALLALRDLLNGGAAGDFRCLYANVEGGQAMRENVAEGMRTVLAELVLQASVTLGDDTLEDLWPALLERVGPGQALRHALLRWCMADPRPLVLLIDEIDALVGDTLLAVLRQLRTGYVDRPARFPHSIILCGVRDVRDYCIHSTAEDRLVLGGSAFNIKSESLRLGDFSERETRALLTQHTDATGQAFTEAAKALIRTRTAGQPWLVNALCYDACFRHEPGRNRARPITADAILAAQERLILRRDTHIDDLAHKLREERVRRVVEPILTGAAEIRVLGRGLGLRARPGAGGAGGRRPAAHHQPDLRGSGAAASELRGAGDAAAANGVVPGRGRRAGCRGAARGVSGVLPRALRALGAALRAIP
ncbi:MAG: ATP-binding protein [Spirochaetaceae bacterium]|nr:ATP-binding protein [Spirochaetaceae bacterium]